MRGPEPPGFWTGPDAARRAAPFAFLVPGKRHRVIAEFRDHDGDRHPAGEEWTFLGHSFLPHEDGMSLFVSLDDRGEWLIPLQWRAESQAAILDAPERYFAAL